MSTRADLLDQLVTESQRHYAAYALFNQTMADSLGIHPTDLQCIALLDLEPSPVTTGAIATLTGLTHGSATRLVDRLEKAGLVVRQADEKDRRRTLVALTPDANTRIGKAWAEPAAAFRQTLESFTDRDLAVIVDYLRRTSEVGRTQAERLTR
ncbi:MarR family winged helix-turn-helix transcriptional regulator [Streptosporangium sp. CA-135522]|uniref:MarR family winged helix-turn-helix transcriptional regulator n=1 Tax=Streptosporangium sp. CA-135522 TaxID=3240072 RepID=UPI003D8A64D6